MPEHYTADDSQISFGFAIRDESEPRKPPKRPAASRKTEPTLGTLNALVLEILSDGQWIMPFEICEKLWYRLQLRASDSSVTARLRDLRKPRFGKHSIELRKRAGSRAYEYRLVK
jgi:hypothetical protein